VRCSNTSTVPSEETGGVHRDEDFAAVSQLSILRQTLSHPSGTTNNYMLYFELRAFLFSQVRVQYCKNRCI